MVRTVLLLWSLWEIWRSGLSSCCRPVFVYWVNTNRHVRNNSAWSNVSQRSAWFCLTGFSLTMTKPKVTFKTRYTNVSSGLLCLTCGTSGNISPCPQSGKWIKFVLFKFYSSFPKDRGGVRRSDQITKVANHVKQEFWQFQTIWPIFSHQTVEPEPLFHFLWFTIIISFRFYCFIYFNWREDRAVGWGGNL